MGELYHDPELNRLVQEMNQLAEGETEPLPGRTEPAMLDGAGLRTVTSDDPLEAVLSEMVRRKASDLLLVPDAPPALRINGHLVRIGDRALDAEEVQTMLAGHLGGRSQKLLLTTGAADFSLRLAAAEQDAAPGCSWRLRVNVQRQRGQLSAAIRLLPSTIPTLRELRLPSLLADLVSGGSGLVLLCGPTGTGKSTTLAALVDTINRTSARHIITIEEPVEYEHLNRSSIIEHVEVGSDAPSFALALRAALRRDPDVILVGEMRDLETMSTAITAAETGHLILSTLHTNDVAQAINRIIDVYPSAQQDQVRQQLALSVHAVVCQQLVPRLDGKGRVPAIELLVATDAIRNHIRKGNLHQLYNELLVGRKLGMCSMEQSLAALVQDGLITLEEARCRTRRPDELERLL